MADALTPLSPTAVMSEEEQLILARWHLDRYDRLRASTAARASVVLSAGALLSAANALIITQIVGGAGNDIPTGVLAACATVAFAGAGLVVLAVLRAASVLVTLRDSRSTFDREHHLPSSPVFNGTDTVRDLQTYDQFASLIRQQSTADAIQAAQVELWLCIHQHRHRYQNLRGAVRSLRWAALAVPLTLGVLLIVELSYRG